MKKKIIVTGGAGFIGSHVVDAYIKAGHNVAVIDNLSTGFRKNLNPEAKFYKADINDSKTIDEIFVKEKPEIVNHHAALASVMESIRDPAETFRTNVLGTVNLLSSLGKRGCGKNKKFIFASTGGAIYGSPKKIPVDEKATPYPLSPYALSKLLGEETIKFYCRSFGFDYLVLRYPNVYGPRQNPKGEAGVVAIFGGMMKHGIKPIIFGDGSKSRDYVYVEDIARANVLGIGRVKNEMLNLGWGKTVTDQKIFDTIKKEIASSMASAEKRTPSMPRYAPYRKGEVYQISLNSKRAKKIIGWQPKTKFEDGVRKTLHSI